MRPRSRSAANRASSTRHRRGLEATARRAGLTLARHAARQRVPFRAKKGHDLSETEFLVDGTGYLIALAQPDLGGHLDYVTRNLIEKWF